MLIETFQLEYRYENVYRDALKEMAIIVLPIMVVAMVAGIGANYLQFGLLFTTETLKFDLKKMDPIKGIKKIISVRAIINLIKSLLKVSFIGAVTTAVIWIYLEEVLALALNSPWELLTTVAYLSAINGNCCIYYASCLFRFWIIYMRNMSMKNNLKMSKQDIKDEHKNAEGDPLIKSKIKQRQREMAMRRMMQEVPHADVVITNPTHFAIALKYDEDEYGCTKSCCKRNRFCCTKN